MTADTYHELGERLDELPSGCIDGNGIRDLAAACERHPDFTIVAYRRLHGEIGVEVECDNRRVAPFNGNDIRPVERLLLIWWPASARYSVRALRKDFPRLIHQNAVALTEAASLCLYAQDWVEVRRKLTPERFLERILTWLAESADGSLHGEDQELEHLFFNGSVHLILPARFEHAESESFLMRFAKHEEGGITTLRLLAPNSTGASVPALVVPLAPVVNQAMSYQPATLGEFVDQTAAGWGIDIETPLRDSLKKTYPLGSPVQLLGSEQTLLLFRIPRLRGEGSAPEHSDWVGLMVADAPEAIALDMGVLYNDVTTGQLRVDVSIAGTNYGTDAWKQRDVIGLVLPRHTLDSTEARRMSGMEGGGASSRRVLAGAGALGSAMLNLWTRSGFGQWSVIDDDLVMPHNLVRHSALDIHIGYSKARAASLVASMALPGADPVLVLPGKIGNPSPENIAALQNAALVVDATTSIYAARSLGAMDSIGRCATVFLTPNGRSSVLMMEATDRSIRLADLEAAYYRAILSSAWGERHLDTAGRLRTGHGCRDASLVLSGEAVALHAAILAAQIRYIEALPEAKVRVWETNETSGAVSTFEVVVGVPHRQVCDGWTIFWDSNVEEKMLALRKDALPCETGGIILGVTDIAAQTIHIVDIAPAPADSVSTPSSFIRGRQGVEAMVVNVRQRTANEVDYVGEWHSHPVGTRATQSPTDVRQLTRIAERLSQDGLPVVQGIAGEIPGNNMGVTWTVDWHGARTRIGVAR